jgi:GR25 family glycosyltransferase involved in LPS biosynthesis
MAGRPARERRLCEEDVTMSIDNQTAVHDRMIAPPRFVRRDFLSAHIVETGIMLQKQYGTEHAAAFLKDNFVHLDVAMRVLLRPAERRRPAG